MKYLLYELIFINSYNNLLIMNKYKLFGLILFQIIDKLIIVEDFTPIYTFITPIGYNNINLRYIIIDNENNNIIYYCF